MTANASASRGSSTNVLSDGAVCTMDRHWPSTQTAAALGRGLWPMMRPGAMSGATRAMRCLWHEIRVDERTVGRAITVRVGDHGAVGASPPPPPS
eukprot:2810960-Prymnesium_polylepis.1